MAPPARQTIPLTAVADGSGIATGIFQGPGRGYIAVDSIAVNVSPSTPRPRCDLYEGGTASGTTLATLRAGDAGTFRSDNDRLSAGQQWTIRWTGANPGATCTAVLRGTLVTEG